jgi:hypothetical protein
VRILPSCFPLNRSIVFEYFFSQTYGSSIARTAQVQALISSGTPQLQLHPKYI